MLEKNRCQNLLKSSNDALLTFTNELKRIKKVIVAAVLTSEESMDSTRINSEATNGGGATSVKIAGGRNPVGGNFGTVPGGVDAAAGQPGINHNMDALLKRLMKFKHLEDDNKKLKNLLK